MGLKHRATTLKENDNIETVKGLNDAVKSWLETLSMPFDGYNKSIENFEFRSRSGFSAFDRNRGGLDLFFETNVSYLISSGEHFGLAIETWTEDSWTQGIEHIKEAYPELDQESDEFHDKVYSSCSNEYDGVAWRVRVMYEGDGVLMIYAGYDTDAPYYRFQGKTSDLFQHEIKFKTMRELKAKLKKLTKKVEDSQNEPKVKLKKVDK